MKFLIAVIITAIVMAFLDMSWFSLSADMYSSHTDIKSSTKLIIGAVIAWVLIALAINWHEHTNIQSAAITGALIGLIVCGVYNASNYAVMDSWDAKLSVVDTMWGTFAFSVASVVIFYLKSMY